MTTPHEGWTIDTALQHVLSLIGANDHRYEQRFTDLEHLIASTVQAQKEQVLAALGAADRAVQKAETAAEKRFESVNEFRNTLSDQQRNLMPRSEVQVVISAQADRIAALESALSNKINALEKQLDALTSERLGIKGGWGYAVGVIGFFLVLVSLGIAVTRFAQ